MELNTQLKRLIQLTLAIILGCVLFGCSSPQVDENDKNDSTASGEAAPSGFPVTIKHTYGETTIESKPERIVTISWSNQDVPLALGVMPVGISETNYAAHGDSRLLVWTEEKIQEIGGELPVVFKDTAGFDFEAISDLKPDVILAAQSGITQEEYELLSEIAPTIAYPGKAWLTTWRDVITLQATAIGYADEGEQLVEDLDAIIEKTVDAHPAIKGKSACFVYVDPSDFSKIYIYTPNDARPSFLRDLGLTTPDSVADLAKKSDSFYLEISSENVDILSDVDIIVGYGDKDVLQDLQADPLFGSIPAIKRGSVVFIQDGSSLAAACSPTALSVPWGIDDYVKLLDEASKQVG